jgi:hypothetical protein
MGWIIKHQLSGQFLLGVDNDDYGQFSDNFATAWWWETEEDANWFIEQKGLDNASASASIENPPGNGQPGKP